MPHWPHILWPRVSLTATLIDPCLLSAMGAEDEHIAMLCKRLSAQREASLKLLAALPCPPAALPTVLPVAVASDAAAMALALHKNSSEAATASGVSASDMPTSAAAAAAVALASVTLAAAEAFAPSAAPDASHSPLKSSMCIGGGTTGGVSGRIASPGEVGGAGTGGGDGKGGIVVASGSASVTAASPPAMSPEAREAMGTLANMAEGVTRARGWVRYGHQWHGHALDLAEALKVVDARLRQAHCTLEEVAVAKATAEAEAEGCRVELAESHETLQRSAIEIAELRLQLLEARSAALSFGFAVDDEQAPYATLRQPPPPAVLAPSSTSDGTERIAPHTTHSTFTWPQTAAAATALPPQPPTSTVVSDCHVGATAYGGGAATITSQRPPVATTAAIPPTAASVISPVITSAVASAQPSPMCTPAEPNTAPSPPLASPLPLASSPPPLASPPPTTTSPAATKPPPSTAPATSHAAAEAPSSIAGRHAALTNRWMADEATRRYEAMLQEVESLRQMTISLQAELRAAVSEQPQARTLSP